ncbi:MAG: N-acetylglucosamine-6-phosphate deacetylase [Phenylobacterium sp.]|nr:N-acetylglucosamine-6-phosphate deacetylase [Phenylobacterium sp.]
MTVFTNCRVVLGPDGETTSGLSIAHGQVVEESAGPLVDLGDRIILPGLIDLQVNGGGGTLFNADPTVEGLRRIAAAHARHGTTALLPTFVTDHLDRLDIAITAVEEAIAAGVPGIAGIHIEGPFLAEPMKGAHDAAKFLPLAAEHLPRLTALRGGPTLITLAPESAAPELISALRARGATVAIGHSNATLAQAKGAIEAGARGFTHLYNSMSPMVEMAPGCVGAALSDDRTWAGIIADGVHVEPEKLRIAYKCKGPERLVLVTDAMPCAGMESGAVFLWEGQAYTARDGACWNDAGVLSGSALTMIQAVRNAVSLLDAPLVTAAAMASGAPAAAMGLHDRGHLRPGARADFIVVDPELATLETWIGGERVA